MSTRIRILDHAQPLVVYIVCLDPARASSP